MPRLPDDIAAYVTAPGLEAELSREVGPALYQSGRLLLTEGPPAYDAIWAQDVWLDTRRVAIGSIKDAAKQLRAIQRNWAPLPIVHHRRVQLITEALPPIKARRWQFPAAPPDVPLGAFTLLDRDTMLFSPTRRSAFAHGEMVFEEDREGPPSRAYRKLWEALSLCPVRPGPGDRCLDLGASPGGWTWVLTELGASVTSIDRAPLAPALQKHPLVDARVGSAFALEPDADAPYDWLFSDIICYPARLLRLVQRWIDAGAAKRVVVTLKFQGETDHDAVAGFAAIEGGKLLHLSHNRHELTFVKLAPGEIEALRR